MWRRLGADVTVLEALPDVPRRGRRAGRRQGSRASSSSKQGLNIHARREDRRGRRRRDDGVSRRATPTTTATRRRSTCDKLIVSIGRVPNTDRPERRSGRPEARRARLHRRRRPLPRPTCRTSARSATSCAARCSRTRPRTRACWSPSSSPARSRTSTSTCVPWVIYTEPGDRLGRQDRAAAEGRGPRRTRRASSRSWPTAARARSATRPASSR